MDKVFSTRIDEAIAARIDVLSRKLNLSKKKVVEGAICLFEKEVEERQSIDILDHTFGAWKREEPAARTVERARKAFRSSMLQHRR